MMVTNHSKDGHQPSKIYQKDEFYKLAIWHLDITHKINTRSSVVWSATIPRMDSHHPMEGHPQSKIRQKEVFYYLQFGT